MIDQLDNYGRKPVAYLPTVRVSGQNHPVVQIVEQASGQVVYTLRINGTTFRPKVFSKGAYTIKVGEGSRRKVIKDVQAKSLDESRTVDVRF